MTLPTRHPCTACGARVPAHQDPPYPGHRPGCWLVKEWLGRDAKVAAGLAGDTGPIEVEEPEPEPEEGR